MKTSKPKISEYVCPYCGHQKMVVKKNSFRCIKCGYVLTYASSKIKPKIIKPKIGTKVPKITPNTLHKAKVVARKRQIQKVKNDTIDNKDLIEEVAGEQIPVKNYVGTHYKSRLQEKKREKRMWRILWVLIGILFLIAISK